MAEAIEINSQQYWDTRFQTDWESKGGSLQTAFFCRIALEAFPAWLPAEIERKHLSICDWGCALGEAADLLARRFAGSRVTGIDISSTAIEKARSTYRNVEFLAVDLKDTNAEYDVIFSSNTLEHFHEPMGMLAVLAAHCRRYLILLLPFQEYDLQPEHHHMFDYGNVPTAVGDRFVLAHGHVVDVSKVPQTHWAGCQALLVYADRGSLTAEHARAIGQTIVDARTFVAPSLDAACERIAGLALKAGDALDCIRKLQHEKGQLQAELAQREQISKDLAIRTAQVAELQQWTASLSNQVNDYGEQIRNSQAQVTQMKGELAALQTQRDSVQHELAALQTQRDSVQQELAAEKRRRQSLEASLAELHTWAETLTTSVESHAKRLQEAQSQLQERSETARRLRSELDSITQGTGWAVLQAMYKVRFFLCPRGSLRERAGKFCMQTVRRARFHLGRGPSAALRATGRALLGRRLEPEPFSPAPAPQQPAEARQAAGPVAAPLQPAARLAAAPEVPGLVSVILPVYNQAGLLRDSMESVLGQTYANFELIIVNDGSTDDVAVVLADYARHPKVRILTQANQKLPKALSNGFAFARGEFWTWTSADNLMEPAQLERLVGFLQRRPDVAMVYANYEAIDDRGQPLHDPTWRRTTGATRIRRRSTCPTTRRRSTRSMTTSSGRASCIAAGRAGWWASTPRSSAWRTTTTGCG